MCQCEGGSVSSVRVRGSVSSVVRSHSYGALERCDEMCVKCEGGSVSV